MPKYIIVYNYGYGETADIVEADSQEEANDLAYDEWRDAAESNGEYWAKPYTKELAENYGYSEEYDDQ